MSRATIIIIIIPPRMAAMQNDPAFCAALTDADNIAKYYVGLETYKPTNDKLEAIFVATQWNSASGLAAANSALLPLPA